MNIKWQISLWKQQQSKSKRKRNYDLEHGEVRIFQNSKELESIWKEKKRKQNKISPPRRGVGKKETRFYRLFSEGNGEMEPPLEDQRALTDVEHALHECRRFLSLLRPTGPGNMAIRRGGNTRLSRKTRKHDTRPGQGPRTRITRVSCDE